MRHLARARSKPIALEASRIDPARVASICSILAVNRKWPRLSRVSCVVPGLLMKEADRGSAWQFDQSSSSELQLEL